MLRFLEKSSERYIIASCILFLVSVVTIASSIILVCFPLMHVKSINWLVTIILLLSSIILIAIGIWCVRKNVKLEQQELEAYTEKP